MRTVATWVQPLGVALAVLLTASCTGTGASTPTPLPTSSQASPASSAAPSASPSPTPTAAPTATPAPSPTATPAATAAPTARPTATPTARATVCVSDPEFDAFVAKLLAELAARNEARLAAAMSDPFDFVVADTDVALPPMTPRAAASALVDGLREPFAGYRPLVPGSRIRCERGVTPGKLFPGNDILKGAFVAAVLTTGWGPKGDEEAFIYLARRADGTPCWRGAWYALAGFRS